MRRLTQSELDFYDGLARRINQALSDPASALTASTLAGRIGWQRASLQGFLDRTDKTIAAHFLPRIVQTLRLSVDDLMSDTLTTPAAERTAWDPRIDDAEILIQQLREWRELNLPAIQLHGHLPPMLLPRRGMVAKYVDSVFDGGLADPAAQWHDVIDEQRRLIEQQGEGDVIHLISYGDLLRLPSREYPFQRFSPEEVLFVLESVKREWVRHRGLALIVINDAALSLEPQLNLSSGRCIGVVGEEVRFEYGNDFRVRWSNDTVAARATAESQLRLKQSAGYGPRERPTTREVEHLLDGLLCRLDAEAKPLVPARHVARQKRLSAA